MERPTDAELAEQYRTKAEARAAKEKAQRKAKREARNAELRAKPSESRAVVKARAQRFQEVARVIERGLKTDEDYRTFHWKGSENHLVQVAEAMGFTLVTISSARTRRCTCWSVSLRRKSNDHHHRGRYHRGTESRKNGERRAIRFHRCAPRVRRSDARNGQGMVGCECPGSLVCLRGWGSLAHRVYGVRVAAVLEE